MDILGFIAHIQAGRMAHEHAVQTALERAAVVVEREAKIEIGVYQGAAGPFAEWKELADATKDDRVRHGYSENDPLLREGALVRSITHTVADHVATIGSSEDIAVYQELGTDKIPPRSFLGGALVRKADRVVQICGETVVTSMFSGGNILPGIE